MSEPHRQPVYWTGGKTNIITCYRTDRGTPQLIDTNENFQASAIPFTRLTLVFAQPDGSQVDYLKINWK